MSRAYDLYLEQHKSNVKRAFDWIRENLPELTTDEASTADWLATFAHDQSKTLPDEYDAYDAYFYGGQSFFSGCGEF